MRRKNKHTDDEFNFWQPASDMFSALLLIFMLIILLLGLYLVHIPDHSEIDPEYGDADGGSWDGSGNPTPTMIFWLEDDDGGGGDDDGGGEGRERHTPRPSTDITPTTTPTPTPTPTPDEPGSGGGSGGGTGGGGGSGDGPGKSTDEGIKVAVYVMLIDAETERTIKEPEVEFELYESDGALQILNTYYPERLTFRSYVTTDSGTFYFPEKLRQGVYELHELTEPEGYDAAENQVFALDREYDWPDPYVVRVPVYPSRNVIRVSMLDAETGLAVAGGSFDVLAAENIITSDGTLRYRTGQIVSTIVCDETGYGESDELYLGEYTVRQRDIPPYYVAMQEDLPVSVQKKTTVAPAIETLACDRTKVLVNLSDELYPTKPIADASFVLRAENGRSMPVEVKTDSRGAIVLDELEKSTAYRLTQTGSAENYRYAGTECFFSVGADGRIEDEPQYAAALTNRMIRAAIGITDEFGSIQIPNISLALYSDDGTMVRTWTSSGTAQQFNGLEPGPYYLIRDGESDRHYSITVRDVAELQNINIYTTYLVQYMVIGGGAVVGLAIVIGTIVVVRKKKRKKLQNAAKAGES